MFRVLPEDLNTVAQRVLTDRIVHVGAAYPNAESASVLAVRAVTEQLSQFPRMSIEAVDNEKPLLHWVIGVMLQDPNFSKIMQGILSREDLNVQDIAKKYFPNLNLGAQTKISSSIGEQNIILERIIRRILQEWSSIYRNYPYIIIINCGSQQIRLDGIDQNLLLTIPNLHFILVYSHAISAPQAINLTIERVTTYGSMRYPNLIAPALTPDLPTRELALSLTLLYPISATPSAEDVSLAATTEAARHRLQYFQDEARVTSLDIRGIRRLMTAGFANLYKMFVTVAALLGDSNLQILKIIFIRMFPDTSEELIEELIAGLKREGVLLETNGFYSFTTPEYRNTLLETAIDGSLLNLFYSQLGRLIHERIIPFFESYNNGNQADQDLLIITILYLWDKNLKNIHGDIFQLIKLHYIIGRRFMLTTGESNLERAKLLLEQELRDPNKITQERVELLVKIYEKYIQVRLLKDKTHKVSELYGSLNQTLENYLAPLSVAIQSKIRADFLIRRAFQGFFSLQMMDIFDCANALFNAAGLPLFIEDPEEVHMQAGWGVYNVLVRCGVFTQEGLNFNLLKQLASSNVSEQGIMQENIIEMLVLLALMNYFMGKHGSAFHYSMLAMRNCLSGSKLSAIVIILFLLNVKFHLDCVPPENVIETAAEFHPKNMFLKIKGQDLQELLGICANTNNAYANLARGLATICFDCLYLPYRQVIMKLQEYAHHCSNIGDLTAAALNAGNALCMETSQTIPSPEQVLAVSEQTDALQTAHDLIAVFGITGMTLLDGNADAFEAKLAKIDPMLPARIATTNGPAFIRFFELLVALLIRNDPTKIEELLTNAYEVMDGISGYFLSPHWYFIFVIARIAIIDKPLTAKEQKYFDHAIGLMNLYHQKNPANYEHMYLTVSALELFYSKAPATPTEIINMLSHAAVSAEQNGFIAHAVLISITLADIYTKTSLLYVINSHLVLKEAINIAKKHAMHAVVSHLELLIQQLIQKNAKHYQASLPTPTSGIIDIEPLFFMRVLFLLSNPKPGGWQECYRGLLVIADSGLENIREFISTGRDLFIGLNSPNIQCELDKIAAQIEAMRIRAIQYREITKEIKTVTRIASDLNTQLNNQNILEIRKAIDAISIQHRALDEELIQDVPRLEELIAQKKALEEKKLLEQKNNPFIRYIIYILLALDLILLIKKNRLQEAQRTFNLFSDYFTKYIKDDAEPHLTNFFDHIKAIFFSKLDERREKVILEEYQPYLIPDPKIAAQADLQQVQNESDYQKTIITLIKRITDKAISKDLATQHIVELGKKSISYYQDEDTSTSLGIAEKIFYIGCAYLLDCDPLSVVIRQWIEYGIKFYIAAHRVNIATKLLKACEKIWKDTFNIQIDADEVLANKIKAAEITQNPNRTTNVQSKLYCSSEDTPKAFIGRYRNALQFSSRLCTGHFVAPQSREPSKKPRPNPG